MKQQPPSMGEKDDPTPKPDNLDLHREVLWNCLLEDHFNSLFEAITSGTSSSMNVINEEDEDVWDMMSSTTLISMATSPRPREQQFLTFQGRYGGGAPIAATRKRENDMTSMTGSGGNPSFKWEARNSSSSSSSSSLSVLYLPLSFASALVGRGSSRHHLRGTRMGTTMGLQAMGKLLLLF
ncbi:hypothetical protein ZWY2020_041118 [Hordeum vulgare]|nr:hypothetical protein ZWY2020_041118 [Hordeum vulgare]